MAWFKKRDDDEYDDEYEEEDEYEDDEDDEDEYEDEDDEYEDDDDYEDDDEPRSPLKGVVIGLAILALLLGAISGLLYMRLKSANDQVSELTASLDSTRAELNTLLSERAAATPTPAPTPEPVAVVDNTPEPVQTVVEETPVPTETPEPTPSPTPSSPYIRINTSKTINITTNPQNATVAAGGTATFTAAATNWAWCAWRFVSPDGSTEHVFDVAPNTFAGLTTAGGNTTTLTVRNIPATMNGWSAVCLFVDNANGMKVTEGGVITISDAG
ncbi:MAG: hypothetical protein IKQ10_03615 [Oscillospiraceae bacterium]|nr:hypothetical protein [Oscillospiraceae bacterium]